MKQSQSLIVLKLQNFNFIAIHPTKNSLWGYRPIEIHCFGTPSFEIELELRRMSTACQVPLHFYSQTP
jgi:hypothetical protein